MHFTPVTLLGMMQLVAATPVNTARQVQDDPRAGRMILASQQIHVGPINNIVEELKRSMIQCELKLQGQGTSNLCTAQVEIPNRQAAEGDCKTTINISGSVSGSLLESDGPKQLQDPDIRVRRDTAIEFLAEAAGSVALRDANGVADHIPETGEFTILFEDSTTTALQYDASSDCGRSPIPWDCQAARAPVSDLLLSLPTQFEFQRSRDVVLCGVPTGVTA